MTKDDGAGLRVLVGELERDMRTLKALVSENGRAEARIKAGATDSLDFAALAYTIHNIYCLLENYFLRVAKTFENHIDQDSWHRDLVRRMSIEVEGVRPALLDDRTAQAVDELRAFRHIFRNIYQTELKAGKVLELQAGLPATLEAFQQSHGQFVARLRAMIDTVGPPPV